MIIFIMLSRIYHKLNLPAFWSQNLRDFAPGQGMFQKKEIIGINKKNFFL